MLTLVYPLFGYALYNFLRNVETDIGIPEYLFMKNGMEYGYFPHVNSGAHGDEGCDMVCLTMDR